MSAQTIMLASGKGGTGKSTISVLVGSRLAAKGKKVLLVELDSGLRSVDIYAGVYGKTVYDIRDVLSGRCQPSKAVVESPLYQGLSIISAPYEGGIVQPQSLAKLVYTLEPFFDYILLDTAAGMDAPFQAAEAVAGHALLVLTADPVALRDGRIVSDHLYTRGITDIRLILNRVTPNSFGKKSPVKDVDVCIDTVCAQLIGIVPEDGNVQTSTMAGTALGAASPAMAACNNIAERMLGKRVLLSYT